MILDDIINKKKITLEKNKYKFDILNLNKVIESDKIQSFYDVLKKDGLTIIGEIKKASPSKGIIKEDFNHIEIAMQYNKAVDAISILTEEHFFMGKLEYIKEVHKNVKLPILRKDFVISPIQIFEAREAGASAILLIAAILNEKRILKEFINIVQGVGMEALVEIHNEKELELALSSNAKIVGINNRNLNDFTENINTTVNLKKIIPKDIIVVSESSIHTNEDIKIIKASGVNGILVGESFMRSKDIVKKAEEFRRAYES